jgi:hypothetical protein
MTTSKGLHASRLAFCSPLSLVLVSPMDLLETQRELRDLPVSFIFSTRRRFAIVSSLFS